MIRYHRYASKALAATAIGEQLAQTIIEDRTRKIGLATGNTVIPIYDALVKSLLNAQAELSELTTFNLDEWGFNGKKLLSRQDVRTFAGFMDLHLFNSLRNMGFQITNAHFPSDLIGLSSVLQPGLDLSGYDRLIEAKGGVDTWLVGIGAGSQEHPYEGHVAFIERSHLLELGDFWVDKQTYTGSLEPDTLVNNSGYQGCDGDTKKVPNLALTVGPATLIRQVKRRLIMAAFGAAKAGALYGACELSPHAGCGASLIQLLSANGVQVDVFMDPAASKFLQQTERFVAI